MTIDGPEKFVEILRKNNKLVEVIPWAQQIINLHENVNVGCKCNKNKRIRIRDESYKEVVKLVLENNSNLSSFIKKELSADEVIFMIDEKELLKI
tara:strand:- start:14062 stop:14346 length:285 start_codon:yes stop_codon:yes gene_type:complete